MCMKRSMRAAKQPASLQLFQEIGRVLFCTTRVGCCLEEGVWNGRTRLEDMCKQRSQRKLHCFDHFIGSVQSVPSPLPFPCAPPLQPSTHPTHLLQPLTPCLLPTLLPSLTLGPPPSTLFSSCVDTADSIHCQCTSEHSLQMPLLKCQHLEPC